MIRYIFLSLFFFASQYIIKATDFNISCDNDLEAAVNLINKGAEMHLKLAPHHYYIKERIVAKANLSIFSSGATISFYTDKYEQSEIHKVVGNHKVFALKSPLTTFPLFYDSKGNLLRLSTSVVEGMEVNYIDGDIIAPDSYTSGVEIKIPISSNLRHLINKTFSKSFGYIDCGWQVVDFKLDHSDSRYFYCTTLNACRTKDFNYDKNYYKKQVRFVLYNVEIKDDFIYYNDEFLFIPQNIGTVYCINHSQYGTQSPSITTYSNFELKGVNLVGFDGLYIHSGLYNKCEIIDCKFYNCLGYALRIDKKNLKGVMISNIKNCIFEFCSIHTNKCLLLYSMFDNRNCINLSNCTLSRYPSGCVDYKNPDGLIFVDGDVSVIENVVYNTCRCHLYFNRGKILAKGNILYNNSKFNSFKQRNLSSDFGFIYCNHVFDNSQDALNNSLHNIIIDGNLIYGAYGYQPSARGIMIDNGRGDVICRNNVIFDTDSYSMASRDAHSFISSSSVRNIFEENILGEKYMLASGSEVPEKDFAISNNNILLGNNKNVKTRIRTKQEDTVLPLQSKIYCIDGKVIISKADYRKLKKLKNWKNVKKFFLIK